MVTDSVALPQHAALLLDLDGTLLDFAPRPIDVVVPSNLPEQLRRIRDGLGGALAIVTGRPIEQIDALLPEIPYAVAGEHGGAIRHGPGQDIERAPLPAAPDAWREQAEAFAQMHPGVLFEPKARGFVLHYRLAPEHGEATRDAMRAMMGEQADAFALLAAQMAWELKPKGADKGTAVDALMQRPPFAGRVPVYIGDDVTDEDGIRAARALGGLGWRVQEAYGDPAGVRRWLASLVAGR